MATNKLNLDKLKLLQTRANCEVAGACVREPFNLPAGCPPVPKPVITVVDTCKLPDLVATKNIISSAVLLTPDIGFSVDTYCVDVKTKISGPGAGSLSWRVAPEAGDCTIGQYELDLSLECPLSPSEIATHGLLTGGITISNCSISGDLCVPEIDINMDCNCKKLITINKRDTVDKPGSDDSGCGLKEYGFDIEVNIPCPILDITTKGKDFVTIKQGDSSNNKPICESGKCEYNWEIEVDCPGGAPGLSLGGDISGEFTKADDCTLNLSLCVPEYTFKTDVNYFCSIDDKDPEEPEDSNDSEDFDYSYYPEGPQNPEDSDYSTTQQPRFTVETTELTPRNGAGCGAKEITFALDIPKPPEIEFETVLKGGCPELGGEVVVTPKDSDLNTCKKTYSIDITLPKPPSIEITGTGIAKVTPVGTECKPSFTIDVPEPCIPEYTFETGVNYVCNIKNPKFTIETTELTSRDGSDCKDKKVTFELDIPKPPELELAFNVVGGCPNTEAKVIPSVSPDGCTKTATLQLTLPEPPGVTINSGKGISVNGGGSPCGGYAYTISLDDDGDDEPCIPVFEAEKEDCDCENSDKKGKKINFTIQSCDCTGSNDETVLCEPETIEGACVCELPEPCTPEITGDNVDCYCGDKSGKQTKITITGCCKDESGVLKPCEESTEITGPCVCDPEPECGVKSVYVNDPGCGGQTEPKWVEITVDSTCEGESHTYEIEVPCSGGDDDDDPGGGDSPGGGEGGDLCETVLACLDELDENDERKICGMIANCSIIDSLSNAIDDLEARLDDMDTSIADVFKDINAQLDNFTHSIGDLYRRMEICCPENNN